MRNKSILTILSSFYFALFIGAFSTGSRMGLGASIVDAGSQEDSQFEKEEIDEEEETRMMHYTSDQLAGIFEESSNYRTSENIDYREVKADLVPSGENDEMYVGMFSSH